MSLATVESVEPDLRHEMARAITRLSRRDEVIVVNIVRRIAEIERRDGAAVAAAAFERVLEMVRRGEPCVLM